MMNSLEFLDLLNKIPLKSKYSKLSNRESLAKLISMKSDMAGIEATIATEAVLSAIFDDRNVPDQLFHAYRSAFPGVSEHTSLYNRYLKMIEDGPESVQGFVTNLKSKVAEMQTVEVLEKRFQNYSFSLSKNQNEPIWDIVGKSTNGKEDIYIQVKSGDENYTTGTISRMEESPDVQFAISREIYNKIAEVRPDLIPQVVHYELSNLEVTSTTQDGLKTLAENMGIDVPDCIGDILPYSTEMLLGIRFLLDVSQNKKQMTNIPPNDMRRVHALKALLLMQKFGVSSVLTTLGAGLGTVAIPVPLLGTISGAVLGAYLAGVFNKKIAPHSYEIALDLCSLRPDDIPYWKNKNNFDSLGRSFAHTRNSFCSSG